MCLIAWILLIISNSVMSDCCLMADNHDLISLKLFELTVERTPEELENEQEVTIPSVDYREIPGNKR